MDYGDIDEVRVITGLTDDDITDEDMAVLLSYARRRFFNDVLVKAPRELITPIDSTRKVYQLEHYPVGSVENGTAPTGDDVLVETMNTSPSWDMWGTIAVEAVDAAHGLIKLTEAPPAGVYVFATYHYFPVELNRRDIDDAVNFMAAHLATLRLEDPATISINDLVNNALVYKENKPTRFLDAYKAKVDAMTGGLVFGAVIL